MSAAATTLLKGAKPQSSQPAVLFENCGKLINAILNKPNTLNALDLDIIRALSAEIAKWNQSPQVKAVTFQGAGGKAFCAGGEIKSVYYRRNEPLDDSFLDYFFREITIWDGLVIGGGAGLSLHAPIKIVTPNAHYFMPEAKLGLHLNMGGGYLFSRMQENIGYFLGLTGYALKGEEIVQCGKLEEKIQEKVNQGPEVDVQDLHRIVKEYAEPTSERYKNADFISKVFGKPTLEEICRELEDRSTTNKFAKELFERVKGNSPVGMKVIYEQIRQGGEIDFKESLKVDMRITKRILAGHDFFEGIRCILVDRGDKPKWQHSSILDVSKKEVENYFIPLPHHLELNI